MVQINKNILINNKTYVILYIEVKSEAQRLIIFVHSIRNTGGFFMKRYSTTFLKIAVILIGIPVLALCIFWLPGFAGYLSYPILIGVYASAITFFFALYQALKLLSYIDKNKAFSQISVNALKYIKNCAITISILFAVIAPLVYPVADADDAPGLLAFPLLIIFASSVIAVFAAVLQRLLQDAIDIKSENDLTV